jgi:hypothetical protein
MTQKEIESHLDQIFPQMLKPVTSEIQECTLVELEKPVYDKYTIAGHKAGSVVWATDCGGIPSTNMMVGTVVGNNIVSLIYRAPEAACLQDICKSHIFDQNLPIAENIMKTIKLNS